MLGIKKKTIKNWYTTKQSGIKHLHAKEINKINMEFKKEKNVIKTTFSCLFIYHADLLLILGTFCGPSGSLIV